MKNKQFFILIILLVIGFASISATLIINGNTKVAANLDDFNVIFIEGFLNGETNEDVVISGDKKTLTFTTDRLTNQGDTARVDYKVKNISTQYDGDVTINCTNEANEYVNVTSSFDGKTLPLTELVNMQAQEVKIGYINAELLKPTIEDKEILITCTINVNATSRTNYAYSLSFNSNGGSTVGDKIVEYNTSYGELSIPEKEGYTFVGWFNEEDVLVDENTVLDTKGNKTLTAKWAKEVYEVNIVKNYPDKSETEKITIPYGDKVNVPINIENKYFINNIECDNGYTITEINKEEVIYGTQIVTINNNSKIKPSTCNVTVLQGIYEYSYIGSEQVFSVPYDGNYKVELWGAQGGSIDGFGAYTSGIIELDKKNTQNLYVYVGGVGTKAVWGTEKHSGGYNGGGNAGSGTYTGALGGSGGSGGGATDIRTTNGSWSNFESLKSRIMVASAGSGSPGIQKTQTDGFGSPGAGLYESYTGVNQTANVYGGARGGFATQTFGGKGGYGNTQNNGQYTLQGENGSFGKGGSSKDTAHSGSGGAGGSGYYGGGASGSSNNGTGDAGGGGSSFISGHNGCDAIAESSTQSNIIHTGQPNHYSGLVFTNTVMIDGAGYNWTTTKGEQVGMPTHDGASTMTGNDGNGYAKITYLGK